MPPPEHPAPFCQEAARGDFRPSRVSDIPEGAGVTRIVKEIHIPFPQQDVHLYQA
jgi:hypothetical protein